jgi:hypothetical protein
MSAHRHVNRIAVCFCLRLYLFIHRLLLQSNWAGSDMMEGFLRRPDWLRYYTTSADEGSRDARNAGMIGWAYGRRIEAVELTRDTVARGLKEEKGVTDGGYPHFVVTNFAWSAPEHMATIIDTYIDQITSTYKAINRISVLVHLPEHDALAQHLEAKGFKKSEPLINYSQQARLEGWYAYQKEL